MVTEKMVLVLPNLKEKIINKLYYSNYDQDY